MFKNKLLLSSVILLFVAIALIFSRFGAFTEPVMEQVDDTPASEPVSVPVIDRDKIKVEPKKEPTVSNIDVKPARLVMTPGSKQSLEVVASLSNQEKRDITTKGTSYQSSNERFLSIDDKGVVHLSEEAKTGDSATINIKHQDLDAQSTVTVKYSIRETIKVDDRGRAVVTNYNDIVVLANKERSLPAGYTPQNLVVPDIPFSFSGKHQKKYLRKVAADALEELFKEAKEDGIKLAAVSGYRSYKRQKSIFNYNVNLKGEEEANKTSARPGESEHQTGLAMDVSAPSVGYRLTDKLGETKEGRWLKENAHRFGFIIRYPKGKEEITGYSYEPWHLRYVGVQIAKVIDKRGITLEEYFQMKS